MKVCVINAFGRSNRGDSVLLDECLAELRALYPGAHVTVALFEGVQNANQLQPEFQWTERIGNARNKLQGLLRMLAAWLSTHPGMQQARRFLPQEQQSTLVKMMEADLVLSAPGGYIQDSNFAYFIALFHIYLATRMRKHTVLAPQSVGPIRSRLGRILAGSVLAKAKFICARESYSYKFLTAELGLNSEIVCKTGDSAFWSPKPGSDVAKLEDVFRRLGVTSSDRVFGITVVDWNFPGHSDAKSKRGLYIKAVAAIADYFSSVHGLVPVIYNQVSSDLKMAEAVRSEATCKIIVDDSERPTDLLRGMIGRSDVFLGSRFHSCIFALMAGRPTVAIAYLPKTTYIMRDLKLEDRVVDIARLEVDDVVSRLEVDLSRLHEAEKQIESAVLTYQSSFERFTDVVSKGAPYAV